jgi:hypothetical protein
MPFALSHFVHTIHTKPTLPPSSQYKNSRNLEIRTNIICEIHIGATRESFTPGKVPAVQYDILL